MKKEIKAWAIIKKGRQSIQWERLYEDFGQGSIELLPIIYRTKRKATIVSEKNEMVIPVTITYSLTPLQKVK
jgi:hypothetical protein